MKKMKRFFALFLAMAMVLGMSMTVFADGENSDPQDGNAATTLTTGAIMVSNLPTDVTPTVSYEQIIVSDTSKKEGWDWAPGVTAPTNVTVQNVIDAVDKDKTDFAGTGVINTNTIVQSVSTAFNPTKTNNVTISGSTATITGVTPGLYVIKVEATGWNFIRMLAYVPFNETNTGAVTTTTVQVKGEKAQVEKAIVDPENGESSTSVTTGDPVPFEITAVYPYYDSSITNKVFTIKDSVAGGKIDWAQGIKVAVLNADDSVVEENTYKTEVTGKLTKSDTSFTLMLGGDNYNSAYAGKTVKVSYTVETELTETVNHLTNTATSETTDANNNSDTTFAEVISPAVEASIVKEAEGENGAKLADAEFTLYVETTKDATHKLDNGTIVAADTGATLKEVTTATSGADGVAKFINLDAEKIYYVMETVAPAGYSVNTKAYKLAGATSTKGTATPETRTVDGKEVTVMVTTNKATNFTSFANAEEGVTGLVIKDTTLSALPSTGGIGTTIFTVGGCAIMILAAGMFFVSRRRASR